MSNSRRKSRIAIFQSIYESELSKHSVLESFENIAVTQKISFKSNAESWFISIKTRNLWIALP